MSVYAFYIFDRHTDCIYTKRWLTPQQQSAAAATQNQNQAKRLAKASDDAKLIFGTVFSLRRMARQLGGTDDQFLSYRTGEYKLHYFETPTQLKFVMLTDVRVGNMRTVLHQIWATLYVEYVVKSPLVPLDGEREEGRKAGLGLAPRGVGVGNELFEGGLEKFIETIFKRDEDR